MASANIIDFGLHKSIPTYKRVLAEDLDWGFLVKNREDALRLMTMDQFLDWDMEVFLRNSVE